MIISNREPHKKGRFKLNINIIKKIIILLLYKEIIILISWKSNKIIIKIYMNMSKINRLIKIIEN